MHNKYNQQCNYSGITMMATLLVGKSKIDQSQTIKIQNTVSRLFCAGWDFIRPHRCSGTNHSSSWTGRHPSGSLPFCLFKVAASPSPPGLSGESTWREAIPVSTSAVLAPVNKSSSLGVTGLPGPSVSISCSVSLSGALASRVGPPEVWPHSQPHRPSSRLSRRSLQR